MSKLPLKEILSALPEKCGLCMYLTKVYEKYVLHRNTYPNILFGIPQY